MWFVAGAFTDENDDVNADVDGGDLDLLDGHPLMLMPISLLLRRVLCEPSSVRYDVDTMQTRACVRVRAMC